MLFSDFENPIAADASADDFKNAVKDAYNEKVGSSIGVTRVMYDANNVVTEVEEDAVDFEYTIELHKRITGQTFTAIQAQGVTGSSPTFVI